MNELIKFYFIMEKYLNTLNEVIKTSIKETFMNVGNLGSVVITDNSIGKRIADYVYASKPILENKKNVQQLKKESVPPISIPVTYYLLIKIGKKEHMERLVKYGEVYMNSTKFFRDNINPEIGDVYEGALHIENGRVSEYRDNLSSEKLFCMWHTNDIFPLHEGIIYSECYNDATGKAKISLDFRKLSGFTPGEEPYMVVIKNPKEFIARFKQACKRAKAEYIDSNFVLYYDEFSVGSSKRLSPFFKREKYSKQQEFRFLVKKDTASPLILKLGALDDIASIYNINEMQLSIVGDCA